MAQDLRLQSSWLPALSRLFLAILLISSGAVTAQDGGVDPLQAAAGSEAAVGETEPEPPARADLTETAGLVREGKYAEAATALQQLVADYPEDVRARLMLGEVLLVGGRHADALPHLEKCVELDAERERVHFQLASALERSGDAEKALEHYAREIEINEDGQVKIMARLNRSMLLQKARQWDGAAAELEAVLALDPDDLRIYGDLAGIYLQAGDLERARAVLVRGAEDGYSSPQHFYVLGTRYYQNESYEAAIGVFTQAIEINAGHADAERALGAALDQVGRESEAARHFRRYLELRPNAPEAAELEKRIAAIGGS